MPEDFTGALAEPKNFVERLQELDPTVYLVPIQGSDEDKVTLLSLQSTVRTALAQYVYLEIGSHIGGTLLPHLLDPACRQVISVDKRPAGQLDQRGVIFDYPENSTARMLKTLEPHVPACAFSKLTTFDSDIAEVDVAAVPLKVDFAFIDGEHTTPAAFRDFLNLTRFLAPSAVVAFHDAHILFDAVANVEAFLKYQRVEFRSFFLPGVVYVLLTGDFIALASEALQRRALDREEFVHTCRVSLWRDIAENARLLQGNLIGHTIGDDDGA